MQREAKITSKGQVTIPLDVRRMLGVKTGDRLLFEGNEKSIQVRAVHEVPAENPFAQYVGISRSGHGLTRKQVVAENRKLRGR